jgi:hypothetical protein
MFRGRVHNRAILSGVATNGLFFLVVVAYKLEIDALRTGHLAFAGRLAFAGHLAFAD